jgi:hypothetical protein
MFPSVNYILSALLLLPYNSVLRIANEARPAESYLFNQYLPEVLRPTYDVNSATMTVKAVMAGLAGTSSNYPPGGFIQASTLNEKTAKIANHVEMQEEDLKTLHMMVQNLLQTGYSQENVIEYIVKVLIDFYDKLTIQAHLDTAEFLRGQALFNGKLDWYNNGIHLEVDYGVPASQFLANRTGTDAYGGTTSKFWSDIRSLWSLLNWNVRAIVMHPTTFEQASQNPYNGIEILSSTGNVYKIHRIIDTPGGGQRPSTDTRETAEIILYGLEATKIDDANPRQTINVPFAPKGKILGVGNPPPNRFDIGRIAVGQGSTPAPIIPLGFTHVAPTIEGGGRMGRWGRVFTPEGRPWAVVAEGVTNALPVIENPNQVAVASSDMS